VKRISHQRFPLLTRLARGVWTFSPHKTHERAAEWFAFLDERKVPSAGKCWTTIASYYGWMTLCTSKGGMGMPEAAVQSLAWLAVPDNIQAYFQWRMKRCDGKMTAGILELLAFITWMVRPGDGYLYQLPHFHLQLPDKYRTEDWHALCERQHIYCQRLQNFWNNNLYVSRNSFDTVRTVIDSAEPMQEVADMVQRMRNDRPYGSPQKEAIWARDILIIKLLASNPLRMENNIHLTWDEVNVAGHRPNDREAVYKRVDGSWWISVPAHLLKNRGGNTKDYDSPIQKSVWPDLERYLFKYRPLLLRWPTDLLILTLTRDPASTVTKHGQPYKQIAFNEHMPYSAIGNHVAKLTARYLRNSNGSRMHAFRHIVATAIMKADGGDVKTAALVLHDKETTVEKHYSGMRSGDGNARMGELLKRSFDRM
jgi:integrase